MTGKVKKITVAFFNYIGRSSISSRLILSSIAIVMSSLLIVGPGLIYIASRTLEANLYNILQQKSETIALMISTYLRQSVNDLELFEDLQIMDAARKSEVRDLLENLIIYRQSRFSQIFTLDIQGDETIKVSRYHTYLANEYANRKEDPAFIEAMREGIYMSPLYVSPESGLLSMSIAKRIRYKSQISVIIAEINITNLWQDISRIDIGQTGYAYIVDSAGRFVASQNPSEVLKRYGSDMSDRPTVSLFTGGVNRIENKVYKGLNEIPVIGCASVIPETTWGVIVEMPSSEAWQTIRHMIWYLSIALLAGTAAAGWVGYLISSRVVRNMQLLTRAAKVMSAGNLDAEVPGFRGNDEVGVLSRTLESMRSELKRLYKIGRASCRERVFRTV